MALRRSLLAASSNGPVPHAGHCPRRPRAPGHLLRPRCTRGRLQLPTGHPLRQGCLLARRPRALTGATPMPPWPRPPPWPLAWRRPPSTKPRCSGPQPLCRHGRGRGAQAAGRLLRVLTSSSLAGGARIVAKGALLSGIARGPCRTSCQGPCDPAACALVPVHPARAPSARRRGFQA